MVMVMEYRVMGLEGGKMDKLILKYIKGYSNID